MEAYEALVTRRSTRKFSAKPVTREEVERIVEAGTRAATARNVQAWVFIAVMDAARREGVKKLCPKNGPFIDVAPVCVAVFGEREHAYWLEDGSAATQNILNAAHVLGLGAVWVAGDKKDYAESVRQYLEVPEKYRLVSLVAIGHPETEAPLTPRKPLEDVLCWDRYSS